MNVNLRSKFYPKCSPALLPKIAEAFPFLDDRKSKRELLTQSYSFQSWIPAGRGAPYFSWYTMKVLI